MRVERRELCSIVRSAAATIASAAAVATVTTTAAAARITARAARVTAIAAAIVVHHDGIRACMRRARDKGTCPGSSNQIQIHKKQIYEVEQHRLVPPLLKDSSRQPHTLVEYQNQKQQPKTKNAGMPMPRPSANLFTDDSGTSQLYDGVLADSVHAGYSDDS